MAEIVDPDVDPVPSTPPEWPVVGAVAAGGVLGALGRYGLTRAWPGPWSTMLINATGCALIGVLMVLVTRGYAARRLVRPFLGVGVLGGYTTFSAYAEQTRELLAAHRLLAAGWYYLGTLALALLAVQVGIAATRRLAAPR